MSNAPDPRCRRHSAAVLLSLFVLAGCGPQELVRERYVYVVQREVPAAPSFVVLPQVALPVEADFAERVESVILGAGFRVLNRPTIRQVEAESASSAESAAAGASGASGSRVTESYYALGETDADYLVYTRAEVGRALLTETTSEAESRADRPRNPTMPGRHQNNVYDVARVRVVERATGELVLSFELTLNPEASENLARALSSLVSSEGS